MLRVKYDVFEVIPRAAVRHMSVMITSSKFMSALGVFCYVMFPCFIVSPVCVALDRISVL